MLRLGGVLQDRSRPAIRSNIVGLVIIFICLNMCIAILNFCRHHSDNLMLLAKCFGLICSFITPVLMVICFLVKREKLMELHETLNDLFERELARDRKTVLATLNVFDRPSYVLWFALSSTSVLLILPTAFSIIHQTIRHVEPRRYGLPLPIKFPWTMPINGFPFYLHFLYELSAFWWVIITVGSVDGLFGFYAYQISSVFRAMSVRLMNTRRSSETLTAILGTCVKQHSRLLRCGFLLDDIWGVIILRMFLTNTILICVLIFEARSFTELTINRGFLFVSYLGLKLLQTFIYAWYGGLITNASEDFRNGIYFSEWLNSSLDRHIRASIVVTMIQKPINITALKMCSVNVSMFIKILNTAISYYFLLRSFQEDE